MAGTEDDLIELLGAALRGRDGLMAAYLFGSRAGGDAHQGSDFDIAVLFRRPLPLQQQINIENDLAEILGRPVDLVDLRRASPFLALDVLHGRRFLELDPVGADEYELYLLRRAGDLEMLERERRALFLGAR